MRRVICFALALLLMLPCCAVTAAQDGGQKSDAAVADYQSKSVLLMEPNTRRVLAEKNADNEQPIASVTKVMTLLLIMEAIDRGEVKLEDEVTVSERAQSMGGSQVFLDANFAYSVEELIKSIVISSANDACVAMSEYLGGSEEAFVAQMNERAKQLGMNNTAFANCTGLPAEGAYSTARDVAVMSAELIQHPLFFQYSTIWMDELPHDKDGRVTGLNNTNKLIRWYAGADGIKTGSTQEAGSCLSATASRNDTRFIAVVLGAPNSDTRFKEAQQLLDYGFNGFTTVDPLQGYEALSLPVAGGRAAAVAVRLKYAARQLVKKGETPQYEVTLEYDEVAAAPIQEGQTLGYLLITENGTPVDRVPLVAAEAVPAASVLDIVRRIFAQWVARPAA